MITITATFPCNHSLPQFPANAPDILSAEMSGIPEILGNVQVNHAFLLRVNYENQSVVHNFFDSNLFLLLRFQEFKFAHFYAVHQQLNTNVHHSSN